MSLITRCFTIKVAGLVIKVETLSTSVSILCRDYLCDEVPDICVVVTDKDVEHEKRMGQERGKVREGVYYECLAVYRKIAEAAIPFGVLLIHGAVVAVGERAFLFTAPSNTGKTTHVKKWLQKNADAYIVNGDKPLIRVSDEGVFACGTPWSGTECFNTNSTVPLDAIVLMERSDGNIIEEAPFNESLPFLLRQTYIPNNAVLAKETLSLLSRLYGSCRFYHFSFNNYRENCIEVSYNTLMEV